MMYDKSIVSGGHLYHKCHVIAWELGFKFIRKQKIGNAIIDKFIEKIKITSSNTKIEVKRVTFWLNIIYI